MLQSLTALFASLRAAPARRPAPNHFRPRLEGMEERLVLAAPAGAVAAVGTLASDRTAISAAGRFVARVLDAMDVEHYWLAETRRVIGPDGRVTKTRVTHCNAFVQAACAALGAPI